MPKVTEFSNETKKAADSLSKTIESAPSVAQVINGISRNFEDGAKAEELYNRLKSEGHTVNIEYANGLFTVHETQDLNKGSALAAGQAAKVGALKAGEGSKEWKAVQDVSRATQKQADDFKIKMGELANKR